MTGLQRRNVSPVGEQVGAELVSESEGYGECKYLKVSNCDRPRVFRLPVPVVVGEVGRRAAFVCVRAVVGYNWARRAIACISDSAKIDKGAARRGRDDRLSP